MAHATSFMIIMMQKNTPYPQSNTFRSFALLVMILIFSHAEKIWAQYENVWMFGHNAGVDFNGTEPVVIRSYYDSLLQPRTVFGEASASVCDADGKLLFYTEGTIVINKEHRIMKNGDSLIPYLGTGFSYSSTSSASQGTIIVPVPGQLEKYYVFSLIANEGKFEEQSVRGYLFYSVIDMRADGGLGAVVAGQKGVLLDTGLTELMTAVAGDEYRVWLLTVSRVSEHLKAFEITVCGINHHPVLSAFPDYLDATSSTNCTGYMTVSPDRMKVAIAGINYSTYTSGVSQRDGVVILDFDTLTGRASNLRKLTPSSYYSVCFSPDNTKLYAGVLNGALKQFDLSAGSLDAIKASEISLLPNWVHPGHIKIAPDNKIYFSRGTPDGLGAINYPNLAGPACQVQEMAIRFGYPISIHLGLPNVIAPRLATSGMVLTNDTGCAPFAVTFSVADTQLIEQYIWDFGDGSALSHQTHPQHTYRQAGTYTAFLYARYKNSPCMDTSFATIVVFPERQLPDIIIRDTLLCAATEKLDISVVIRNPGADTRIQWGPSEGIMAGIDSTTLTVNPNISQVYYVRVADTIPGICGLSVVDTVHIDLKPRILEIKTNDTLVCEGTEIPLIVNGSPEYTYQWTPPENVNHPHDLRPVIRPSRSTIYTITASYPGCADTAQSIAIDVEQLAGITFLTQTDSICQGESLTFYPRAEGNKHTLLMQYWQYGDGEEALLPNEAIVRHAYQHPGTFTVILTGRFRVCPDTTFMHTVYVQALPYIDLGNDTSICLNGAPILLRNLQPPPQGGYRSLWNTGDTTETLKVLQPGKYSLTLSSGLLACSSTETITIEKDCYLDIPNAFSPNGDGVNDYFFPRQLLSKGISDFNVQVFNRWGQLVFETNDAAGRGWDGKFQGLNQPQGVYVYRIKVNRGGVVESYDGQVTLVR